MRLFGLIGFPLGHSFSPGFFSSYFSEKGIADARYELFPMESPAGLPELWNRLPELEGLNVTLPHKETVLPYLNRLHPLARRIGAVNTLKRLSDGTWMGFNTDYTGFRKSLLRFLPEADWKGKSALIFGTGGSSRAVKAVLEDLGIGFSSVSRTASGEQLSYGQLSDEILQSAQLLIQTTPVGMFPHADECLPIRMEKLKPGQMAIDLIYNPEETIFLARCRERGLHTQNGLFMLQQQALAAWEIWNGPDPESDL